jgi:hypothetical protein
MIDQREARQIAAKATQTVLQVVEQKQANLLVRNGEVRPASVAALYVEFLDAVIAAEDEWIRKRASQTV